MLYSVKNVLLVNDNVNVIDNNVFFIISVYLESQHTIYVRVDELSTLAKHENMVDLTNSSDINTKYNLHLIYCIIKRILKPFNITALTYCLGGFTLDNMSEGRIIFHNSIGITFFTNYHLIEHSLYCIESRKFPRSVSSHLNMCYKNVTIDSDMLIKKFHLSAVCKVTLAGFAINEFIFYLPIEQINSWQNDIVHNTKKISEYIVDYFNLNFGHLYSKCTIENVYNKDIDGISIEIIYEHYEIFSIFVTKNQIIILNKILLSWFQPRKTLSKSPTIPSLNCFVIIGSSALTCDELFSICIGDVILLDHNISTQAMLQIENISVPVIIDGFDTDIVNVTSLPVVE